MKKLVLLLGIILSITAIVQAQGIRFEEGSWSQMLKKAKQEGKLIFVDVYTSWCGPCKMVASTVFTQEILGKFHNEHFINYKIDAEKGEGLDFAKNYGVKSYPTFYYIDADGEVIFQSVGGQTVDEFLEKGKRVASLVRYGGYDKVYAALQEGKATPEMFLLFYEASGRAERDEVLNVYLKGMSPESFFREGYKWIKDIHLYDVELMNRLASTMVRQSKDACFTGGVYDSLAFSSIASNFEQKVSEMLEKSIQHDDSVLCNNILSLKKIYEEITARMEIKSEVVFYPTQFMLVSPDYIRFCYGAENCTGQKFFKEKFIPYMNVLVEQNPTNRQVLMNFAGNSMVFPSIAQSSSQATRMTSLNILRWVDYYRELMPLDEEQTAQCVRYVKYAYDWLFYDNEIALLAANLLVKLGATDECIIVLEDNLSLHQQLGVSSDKMKRKLELKLRLAKEGRL